jgi:hypothetical protein
MNSSVIDPAASESLKEAVTKGGPTLIVWCKNASDGGLRDALKHIYRHNDVYLDMVREEIEERRHREVERRLEELKKPHWTVLPNFWLTALSAFAAIVAAILAWLALKP